MVKTTKNSSVAYFVVLGGIAAALHIAKLPPAIPILRESLNVTLVQAGFLLSLVQLAGMTLGLAFGLMSDVVGLRRSMGLGLSILATASLLGGFATTPVMLLTLRALEGVGFLMTTVVGPSLIKRLVEPSRLPSMMGAWGTYMPAGAAIGLLAGPLFIANFGWHAWWWIIAAVTYAAAASIFLKIPADPPRIVSTGESDLTKRVALTLTSAGPWLVAVAFTVYAGQWIAVVGFLPSIYSQAGVSVALVGVLTAIVAAGNIIGNIATGWLNKRGVAPQHVLYAGYCTMALTSFITFVNIGGFEFSAIGRYIAVFVFSAVGGVIPGSLFALGLKLAPNEKTVSTTIGWMQQMSAVGQFSAPPLVALVASHTGSFHWTWVVTLSFCMVGLILSRAIGVACRRREAA